MGARDSEGNVGAHKTYVQMHIHAYMHTYLHTYIHTYAHIVPYGIYMHKCMCMHAFKNILMHMYMYK